jgi:hypothetical protein
MAPLKLIFFSEYCVIQSDLGTSIVLNAAKSASQLKRARRASGSPKGTDYVGNGQIRGAG